MTTRTPEYAATFEASSHYDVAGVRVLLDLAIQLYKRKGQRRAAKAAQFQRVLALRDRMQALGAVIR